MTGEARTAGLVAVATAAGCLAVNRIIADDLATNICDITTGREGLSASQGMLAVVGTACCAQQAVNGGALCGDPQPRCTGVSIASTTSVAVRWCACKQPHVKEYISNKHTRMNTSHIVITCDNSLYTTKQVIVHSGCRKLLLLSVSLSGRDHIKQTLVRVWSVQSIQHVWGRPNVLWA